MDFAGLPDAVPGPLGKKTKSNASDLSPAVGGPRSAADDASNMHGMPSCTATTLRKEKTTPFGVNDTGLPRSQQH